MKIKMTRIVVSAAVFTGILAAQSFLNVEQPLDAICTNFLPKKGSSPDLTSGGGGASPNAVRLGALTDRVTAMLGTPGGSRTGTAQNTANMGLIDQQIFSALESAGVQPAEPTTDWEFIRRVTLDLTGRIPAPARVLAFVADATPNKRAALVDELMAKPEWLDKWTTFFGDKYRNNSTSVQVTRFPRGVTAFQQYIRGSLAANKPYDVMARELIAAQGGNSYQTGEINFTVGGIVTNGPVQDIYDQQTVDVAQAFLGVSHVNCLLCHNGAGHLTTLSLWGSKQTRVNAWGLAAFMTQTATRNALVDPNVPNIYYWSVQDNATATTGYRLNTTTGNRPVRAPIGTVNAITPTYMFTGEAPAKGESYRAALARMVTADPQFSRATVNYMWEYFFGVGLVDPSDAFDPLRLDPDNPPPAPWTLQPSNPRLLNALTKAFIDNKYDLKWLMRAMVNSQAYQLQSRYDGQWNVAWNNLFGRKLVRRLWAEELHDAISVSSNFVPTYNTANYGVLNFAMQFPEPVNMPDGSNGKVNNFLNAFLRGNRDDEFRNDDGSILQALNLMNDSFVMTRTSAATPAGGLLPANIGKSNPDLVNTLFLAVLSRYPTDAELAAAVKNLSTAANRNQEAQYLLWSLYNKVDFIFNY